MGEREKKTKPSSMAAMATAMLFTATCLFCFSAAKPIKTASTAQMKPANRSRSSLVFPVQGDISRNGFFSTTLYLGNPPKPYVLDIDTGSNLTWVQCAAGPSSKLLKAPNSPYRPNRNAVSCKDPLCPFVHQPNNNWCKTPNDQCDYEVQYADYGSSLGVLVKDSFPFKFSNGSGYGPSLAFGCGYDQEYSDPFSQPYVDGVLGLAYGKSSIVSQLSNLGVIRNVIGHCLPSQGNGYLFFGDGFVPSGLVWANILPNSLNHYLVGPMDLLLGGKTIGARGLDIIFDSGSTYTYLNSQAYRATLSLITTGLSAKPLSSVQDGSLPKCWKGAKPFKSVDEIKTYFSPLVLNLTSNRNVQFVLPPEGYILVNSRGNACLGILSSAGAKLGDMNIIGDISLQGKLVVYDNERQMIGWTPFNCNRPPKGKR